MLIILRGCIRKIGSIGQIKNNSLNQDASIIVIRHAQSQFNKACDSQAQRLGIKHLPWNEQEVNKQFRKAVCFNKKYMDSPLTPEGMKECQKANQKIKNMQIDMVLVSPLQRSLQSCELILKGLNLPILVEPLFAQSCRFSCDGIKNGKLKQKIQKYSKFDFQLALKQKIAYSVPDQTLQLFEQICKRKGITNQQQKYEQLMVLIGKQMIFQNNTELRKRAWAAKMKLLQLSNTYKNILIISHWYILTTMLSQKFSPTSQNLQYLDLQNCKPYTFKLSELLKIK